MGRDGADLGKMIAATLDTPGATGRAIKSQFLWAPRG
jgi:hypothetical protein